MHAVIACLVASSAVVGASADPGDTARAVDQKLAAAWIKSGIEPAAAADDARFLRRAFLDVLGVIPTPEQVERFLASTDPDKRTNLVTELLKSPAYGRRWGDYWNAVLMGRDVRVAYLDKTGFYRWLVEQFMKNRPWDELAYELVTASGYNTNVRPQEMKSDPKDFHERYSPASNWFLRYYQTMPELSGATAKVLLGVQIQCAQCHDHKTEHWTQKDFRQFTAFYAKTFPTFVDRQQRVGIRRLELRDRPVTPPTVGQTFEQLFGSYKEFTDVTPKFLDGEEFASGDSRREALGAWMTAEENPWFARAIVNRMWALFMGSGFVEPIDDFRPSNPAVQDDVLDFLANDFKASGYDLHHLIQVITSTQAYQLDCRAATASTREQHLWSSYPLKSLDAEVLFDIVMQATDAKSSLQSLGPQQQNYLRHSFVREFVSQMNTDEVTEVANFDETLQRSLMLLNGNMVNGATLAARDAFLEQLLSEKKDDSSRIEYLYLKTLSRRPTESEAKAWQSLIGEPRDVVQTSGGEIELPIGTNTAVSEEIAKAEPNADFRDLLKFAKTTADFTEMRKRVRNNADGALYVKRLEEWTASVPFEYLSSRTGGTTAETQAYEDMFWALLNSSEFLSNH